MACRADLEQLDLQMGLLDVHTKQLMRMQSSIAPMNQDSGGANGGSSPSQQSDQAAEVRKTKKLFSCRACADCGTQFTSQWRVGPYGPSTLCNACGIRYARKLKKERQQNLGDAEGKSIPQRTSIEFLLN